MATYMHSTFLALIYPRIADCTHKVKQDMFLGSITFGACKHCMTIPFQVFLVQEKRLRMIFQTLPKKKAR